jgi:hypothetical protein
VKSASPTKSLPFGRLPVDAGPELGSKEGILLFDVSPVEVFDLIEGQQQIDSGAKPVFL